MKRWIAGMLAGVILTLTGCGNLFHPQAQEYLEQAKRPTAVDTALSLTRMMQESIQQAMIDPESTEALDRLHNQFHALHEVFCQFPEGQRSQTAYIHAATLQKGMRTLFHRLWKYREDPVLRNLHLGLFAARLREFQLALEGLS